ncbi:universal stress protein [Thalassovita aquimarina]|uniref:Universal stress protein n=1 Tax=Thalassovita aquimarina TaxID=2785917 RepID=A0ABS5HVZ1_9RHOB|nr:universal stress protein [Thalassovita aquimarina]MBR9653090.1 universal stress protein [Thalassovita aquimarina]
MSNCILCAVDMSQHEPETEVLKVAAKLAALDGAQLDVITVVPSFGAGEVPDFFPKDYHHKAVEKTAKRLKGFVRKVLGDEVDAGVRHEVATGKVYQEVLHAAEVAGSDLIVIGSHRPSARDYLLGTNAAKVVRHASVSVYVVRS